MRARFGSTYTKIGTIQRRLTWPLRKDDTQIREAFHIFLQGTQKKKKYMHPHVHSSTIYNSQDTEVT